MTSSASRHASTDLDVGLVLTFGIALLGAALVVSGVVLLHSGATYQWSGAAPRCDGEAMAPGDLCLSWGPGSSYDFEEGVADLVSSGRFIRSAGGILAGGVGALLIYSAAAIGRRAVARIAAGAGVLVLLGAAGWLMTIGSATASVALACALLVAVALTVEVGILLGRLVYYLTSLLLLALAAAAIRTGADYHFEGRLAGADAGQDWIVWLSDVAHRHGDWVRYAAAALVLAVAWRLVRTGLDGRDPHYLRRRENIDMSVPELEVAEGAILSPIAPVELRNALWVGFAFVAVLAAGALVASAAPATLTGGGILAGLALAAALRLRTPTRVTTWI